MKSLNESDIQIGKEYSLPALSQILNIPEISKVTTGISKHENFVFLFHTLDNPKGNIEEDRLPPNLKEASKKSITDLTEEEFIGLSRYLHDYNNFFTYEHKAKLATYEWEGQPGKSISDPLIGNFLLGSKYHYLLFARLNKKTNNFVYCGEIRYLDHYLKYPNRSSPVRIISRIPIRNTQKLPRLKELYEYIPSKDNLSELKENQKYITDIKTKRFNALESLKGSSKVRGDYAEERGKKFYKQRGFTIEDVSDYGSGCDFIATRWNAKKGREEKRYVEVKSTVSKKEEYVSISRLQVEKSIRVTSQGDHFDLFILRKIQMIGESPSGGEIYLITDYDAKIQFPNGAVKVEFSPLRLGTNSLQKFK